MKVIIEFVGGFNDGRTYVGDTDHGPNYTADELEAGYAAGFYLLSNQGAIGARFMGLSDHTIDLFQSIGPARMKEMAVKSQKHIYEVFDRYDGVNEVLIRVAYVPSESNEATAYGRRRRRNHDVNKSNDELRG
jgi:hypothetical protein